MTEYRKSYYEWLGDIPVHWEEPFIQQVSRYQKNMNYGNKENVVLSLSYGNIIRKMNVDFGLVSSDLSTYQIVDADNIIMRLTDLQNDHKSLRTGIVRERGIISPAYVCLVPSGIVNPRYLHYVLHTYDERKIFYSMGGGVRQSIGWDDIRHMRIPLPPKHEQNRIASCLDAKVSALDRLSELTRRQAGLLAEYREAYLNETLAQYPVQESIRMKYLGQFRKGGGFSRANLMDDGEPAILYGDIYTQYRYTTDTITHRIDAEAYAKAPKIEAGDIVMTGTGETKNEIGKPILYTGDGRPAVGGDAVIFHNTSRISSKYILYSLYGKDALYHRYINGRGDIIVHISSYALGNQTINILKPEDEAEAVREIEKKFTAIDKMTELTRKKISLLKEYRTRLIYDAVTEHIEELSRDAG